MTWMGEGEKPDEAEITEIQKFALLKMAEHLDYLADRMSNEPIDPKVEAHLRMSADCLKEQVQLDKFYPWEKEETETETKEEPNTSEEYLLLDNDNKDKDDTLPSIDELKSWFAEKEIDDGEPE